MSTPEISTYPNMTAANCSCLPYRSILSRRPLQWSHPESVSNIIQKVKILKKLGILGIASFNIFFLPIHISFCFGASYFLFQFFKAKKSFIFQWS